jgi:hypothetical protein
LIDSLPFRVGVRTVVLTSVSRFALLAFATGLGAFCSQAHASTFIHTSTYNLDLDSTGSSINSIGSVSITSNTRRDTLTYTFTLNDRHNSLTEVFLDAGPGGTARHDLGPTTNSLGTFTDSFAAHGRRFSIKFNGTDVADSTLGLAEQMFGGVLTTKGLFGDGIGLDESQGDPATPLPAAFPLFATGLGAVGLLGWRRNRKSVSTATA